MIEGILNQVGTLISKVISPRKAIIVTDKTVAPLYGHIVLDSLSECKFDVKLVSMELGEEQKSMAKAEELYESLFDYKMDRKSLIVALGGGVLGGFSGFRCFDIYEGYTFCADFLLHCWHKLTAALEVKLLSTIREARI